MFSVRVGGGIGTMLKAWARLRLDVFLSGRSLSLLMHEIAKAEVLLLC